MSNPHGHPQCWSCGVDVVSKNHCGVAGVEVCEACWRKVSVVDRINVSMSVLDRAPGGVLCELAQALSRVEQHDLGD